MYLYVNMARSIAFCRLIDYNYCCVIQPAQRCDLGIKLGKLQQHADILIDRDRAISMTALKIVELKLVTYNPAQANPIDVDIPFVQLTCSSCVATASDAYALLNTLTLVKPAVTSTTV